MFSLKWNVQIEFEFQIFCNLNQKLLIGLPYMNLQKNDFDTTKNKLNAFNIKNVSTLFPLIEGIMMMMFISHKYRQYLAKQFDPYQSDDYLSDFFWEYRLGDITSYFALDKGVIHEILKIKAYKIPILEYNNFDRFLKAINPLNSVLSIANNIVDIHIERPTVYGFNYIYDYMYPDTSKLKTEELLIANIKSILPIPYSLSIDGVPYN